jgi:hypothetical protein
MEITIGSQARTLWNRSLFVSGSQWRTYVNMAICASCVTSSTVSHRSSWPKATGLVQQNARKSLHIWWLATWPYCNVPDMMQCTAYHDLSRLGAQGSLDINCYETADLTVKSWSKKRERATLQLYNARLRNAMSHVFLPVGDMTLFMGLWPEPRGNCTMSSYYLFSMIATL